MGNPVLSRDSIADYSSIFYQWGLIDSQGLLAVKPLQDEYNKAVLREELLNKLDDISMQQQTFNILVDSINHLDDFVEFIRRPEVSEALHVGTIQFAFHNGTTHKRLTPDFLSEVRSKVEMLLNHYRILIYCGQMDLTAPCVPNAKARRKHWHWNKRNEFLNASRTPWWFDERVAGGLELPLPPNYHVVPQDTAAYVDDDLEGISKTILQIPGDPPSGTQAVMVVSLVLNVLLILAIVCGAVYGLRWKRRTDAYNYKTVDETSITTSTMF
ncbi:hypothetical protein HF086_010439 [Spodoptera exigua]|uniref:Uncharacterized protein n=1 Tax=Spodoptera exigua TaxID=7107 RepID=A0A922MU78_SPOEX|nr:hypothetical protein HF086_010439 [Spodoptera exigua]